MIGVQGALVIGAVVALMLLAAFRLARTAKRLDRLHVRTETAWAALDQALARRIVATRALAAAGHLAHSESARLREAADRADRRPPGEWQHAEHRLQAVLGSVSEQARGDLAEELADAEERVILARQFYNDAVRDTRALRASWFTRLFRLAGHAALPDYFHPARQPSRTGSPTGTVAR